MQTKKERELITFCKRRLFKLPNNLLQPNTIQEFHFDWLTNSLSTIYSMARKGPDITKTKSRKSYNI